MDSARVREAANDALGIETSRGRAARASAAAAPKQAPPSAPKRATARAAGKRKRQIGMNRAHVRAAWKKFAFSTALDGLHRLGVKREHGEKDQAARRVMRQQFSWISGDLEKRNVQFGEAGRVFSNEILEHYERSVQSVRIESDRPSDSKVAGEYHCAIARCPIGASVARRVFIKYRVADPPRTLESPPLIVTREWAQRIASWFTLLRMTEKIKDIAVEMRSRLARDKRVVSVETLARWKNSKKLAISETIANDDALFESCCAAVRVWLDPVSASGEVWPGWFEKQKK